MFGNEWGERRGEGETTKHAEGDKYGLRWSNSGGWKSADEEKKGQGNQGCRGKRGPRPDHARWSSCIRGYEAVAERPSGQGQRETGKRPVEFPVGSSRKDKRSKTEVGDYGDDQSSELLSHSVNEDPDRVGSPRIRTECVPPIACVLTRTFRILAALAWFGT